MRLLKLDPSFLRYEQRIDGVYFVRVESIGEAQGIEFLCPKCFTAHGGPIGTHRVICWSRSAGAPDNARPAPGRWRLAGTNFDDLTLEAEPGMTRSVLVIGGCAWHGYVTAGEVSDA
jgi:hypothetical protein